MTKPKRPASRTATRRPVSRTLAEKRDELRSPWTETRLAAKSDLEIVVVAFAVASVCALLLLLATMPQHKFESLDEFLDCGYNVLATISRERAIMEAMDAADGYN